MNAVAAAKVTGIDEALYETLLPVSHRWDSYKWMVCCSFLYLQAIACVDSFRTWDAYNGWGEMILEFCSADVPRNLAIWNVYHVHEAGWVHHGERKQKNGIPCVKICSDTCRKKVYCSSSFARKHHATRQQVADINFVLYKPKQSKRRLLALRAACAGVYSSRTLRLYQWIHCFRSLA